MNGSSWTEVNDLNQARNGSKQEQELIHRWISLWRLWTLSTIHRGCSCKSWNGSSWTEVNDLNTARYGGGGGGTQTAAILSGGNPSIKQNRNLEWI